MMEGFSEQMARDSEDESALSEDETQSIAQMTTTSMSSRLARKRKIGPQKTSCEMCKLRKVKCDRVEPACSWCARHNRECIYKERRNHFNRTDQMVELEAKVKRLDALLQALGRRVEEHVMHDHMAGIVAISTVGTSERSNGPGLNSPQASIATTEPQGPSPLAFSDYFWDPQRNQSQASIPDVNGIERMSVPPPLTKKVGQPAPIGDFPPHEILYTLVDLYFREINTWVPILDRKTTFGAFFGSTDLQEADQVVLHAIVASTLRFCNDPRMTPGLKSHYHDLSSRKVENYVLENNSIDALRALLILVVDYLGTCGGLRGQNFLSLMIQQAKNLGLFSESRIFPTVGLDGTSGLGSARMVAVPQPNSFIEDEGRRRLAWSIYQLDRYNTLANGCGSFMLEDSIMQRHLPCSYDLFSKNIPVETRPAPSWAERAAQSSMAGSTPGSGPGHRPTIPSPLERCETLGSFSYHCQILRILSGVHEFVRTPVDVHSVPALHAWRNTYRALDDALNSWLQSLPGEYSRISSLCHSDPASRVANWFLLHSMFVTTVLRLHSSAAYPSVSMFRSPAAVAGHGSSVSGGGFTGPGARDNNNQAAAESLAEALFTPSYHAMQRCLTAVNSLCDIVRDVLEMDGLHLLGPPFASSLWIAARLLLLHAAAMETPVDPKIDFFVSTLETLARHWEIAGHYARILSRVVARVREGTVTFRAMRRMAYELTALASSTRRSGLEPTATRLTSQDELDCVDVFDLFNVPKMMPSPAEMMMSEQGMADSGALGVDWLGYGT